MLALEQRLILGMGRGMSCIFLSCVGLLLDGMCGNNEGKFLCDSLQHLNVVEDGEYSESVHRCAV
jgi:hypothetical protein